MRHIPSGFKPVRQTVTWTVRQTVIWTVRQTVTWSPGSSVSQTLRPASEPPVDRDHHRLAPVLPRRTEPCTEFYPAGYIYYIQCTAGMYCCAVFHLHLVSTSTSAPPCSTTQCHPVGHLHLGCTPPLHSPVLRGPRHGPTYDSCQL
jgi:hypothetical protein